MLWILRVVAVPFRYFHPLLVYQRGTKVRHTRPAIGVHISGHYSLSARETIICFRLSLHPHLFSSSRQLNMTFVGLDEALEYPLVGRC